MGNVVPVVIDLTTGKKRDLVPADTLTKRDGSPAVPAGTTYTINANPLSNFSGTQNSGSAVAMQVHNILGGNVGNVVPYFVFGHFQGIGTPATVIISTQAIGGSFEGGSQTISVAASGYTPFCIVTFCYGAVTQFQVLANTGSVGVNFSGGIYGLVLT